MAQKLDLGRERISRLFVLYAVPSVISTLGMSIFIVIDGVIIGQFVGPEGLAAVNLAMPFLCLSWALAAMIASGGLAQTTIELGREDIPAACDRFSLAAAVLLIIFAVFLSLALLFGDQIAALSGAQGHLIGETSAYIKIIAVFSLFWCGTIYLDTGVRSMGNPRLSMIANLLASVINIFFDLLFVGVFGWGIRGAALGSGLGFVVSFAILLRQYLLPQAKLKFQRFKFRLRIILKIMANGSSEALAQLSVGITTLLFNLALMARIGETGVAAFSIILYLHDLLMALVIGISGAVIPIISYNYGALQPRRVISMLKMCLKTVLLIGVLTTVFIYLSDDMLVSIFTRTDRDQALIQLTTTALRLFAPCYLFIGINIIASAYFTAMEDALRSALISTERSLLFILPGLAVLPLLLGTNGIWLAIPAAELLTLLCSAPMLACSVRRLRRQAAMNE